MLVAVFVGSNVWAQGLISPIGNDKIWAEMSGYTHVYYLPESSTSPNADKVGIPDDSSDVQWGLCRVMTDIKSMSSWAFHSEIEAVDLNDSQDNWLRVAQVSYKANNDWTLYAGRVFLAAQWSTPGAADLETIQYPRIPFPCYAYGVQASGNLGDGMSILFDITGKSGVSFDSDENWDGLESSAYLKKTITKNLSLAETVEISDNFGGFALDSEYRIGKFCLKGAGYIQYDLTDEARDIKGFYAYSGYEILKRTELHAQYDHQVSANDILTAGTRLWAPNDQVSLTLDYEYVPDQNDDSRVIARVEARF